MGTFDDTIHYFTVAIIVQKPEVKHNLEIEEEDMQ